MSAGVGKTYRMLQDARTLLRNSIDVKIAYIETHQRQETNALLDGVPVIPRRSIYYKGHNMQEMDLDAVIALRPELVIVDELAHSNVEGSRNKKRWQDVIEILHAGINVISAVNIQHIESLCDDVKAITGVEVAERIPDSVLRMADEVVNIDLTADDLLTRLKEGKIYATDKIPIALKNFFQPEKILQLRELALKEVATQVERKIQVELPGIQGRQERLLCCISTNHAAARLLIRKTARLATCYNAQWYVLFVQTARENPDNIRLSDQRHLINNFKLATEMGAEVIRTKHKDVGGGIIQTAINRKITTICMGQPHFSLVNIMARSFTFNHLLKTVRKQHIDLVILS